MIKFILIIFFNLNSASAEKIEENNNIPNQETQKKIEEEQESNILAQKKIEKNYSIMLESSFAIMKNNLLEKKYSSQYSIPYIGIISNYQFSKNSSFKTVFSFSNKERKWSYSIEEVFIKYSKAKLWPIDLTIGYFEYPVLQLKTDGHNISKKALLKKIIIPLKDNDMGALIKINFWQSFYLKLSSYIFTTKLIYPLNTAKNTWTVSLGFQEDDKYVIANYFKQKFFSKNEKESFGLSSYFSRPFNSLLFGIEQEIWKTSYQNQDTLNYYIFPSVKWNSLVLSFLFEKAFYKKGTQSSESVEYLLKADFYLTDELFITLERFTERDTIIKSSFWGLSIRSEFKL